MPWQTRDLKAEAQHKEEITHHTKGIFMEEEVISKAKKDTTSQNLPVKFATNMGTQLQFATIDSIKIMQEQLQIKTRHNHQLSLLPYKWLWIQIGMLIVELQIMW